jgi:hypothetical protein
MLLVYEPFDYEEGVLAGRNATGQNLTGSYSGLPVPPGFELRVESPGLDYGALVGAPAATGRRLVQNLGTTPDSATVAIDADVSVEAGSAIYWSALLRLDDSSNGNHRAGITLTDDVTGDSLWFGETVVGVRAIGVFAYSGTTGDGIGEAVDLSFTSGDVLLLVGRYANSAASGGDSLELLGYDTSDADLLPPSFDPSDPNAEFAYGVSGVDVDIARLGSVTFTIRGTANNFIDELRIGTSYADAVPEPETVWLLGAGLVGLRLLSRRRSS